MRFISYWGNSITFYLKSGNGVKCLSDDFQLYIYTLNNEKESMPLDWEFILLTRLIANQI